MSAAASFGVRTGGARPLAGTGTLLRFALRRDRVLIPVWTAVNALMVLSMPGTIEGLYGTAAERADLMRQMETNSSLRAMVGPVFDDSLGALTAWRVGVYAAALAADPDGAVFALWQPGRHRGFGRRHEPGAFAWAELYTRNTEAANAFYGDLFHEALFGPDASHHFGRAPVSDVFPAEMPPHFLVHFQVEDCEAALGAVARLGGRVRVPPFETSYGRVAVVSDGQGASFALLQR